MRKRRSGQRAPRAHGAAVLSAQIRTAPEDFVVEELPGFEASGSGEHLLLTIEKRGMNTAFAAKRIAAWAGIGEMRVGYAGLKDRHAVTRQRFSVHLPRRDRAAISPRSNKMDLRVLESDWHARKLAARRARRQSLRVDPARCAGEREPLSSSACSDRGARRAELFRRTALRPRWRQRRQGAGDVPRAAASAASNADTCCRRRVRPCSTGCSRARLATAAGSARWTARSGCWTAIAACSVRSH